MKYVRVCEQTLVVQYNRTSILVCGMKSMCLLVDRFDNYLFHNLTIHKTDIYVIVTSRLSMPMTYSVVYCYGTFPCQTLILTNNRYSALIVLIYGNSMRKSYHDMFESILIHEYQEIGECNYETCVFLCFLCVSFGNTPFTQGIRSSAPPLVRPQNWWGHR